MVNHPTFSSGFVSCVSPSMESLAVEMLDMLESSSMPRLARELSPSSVNSLLCFGSLFVFVLINWETGIHLNCFMVVSGICIQRFSQCRTCHEIEFTKNQFVTFCLLKTKSYKRYDDNLVHAVHHPLDVLLPTLPGFGPG